MPDLPPLPYLFECADSALFDLEFKSLDLASQCEKRAKAELVQAVSHRGTADVCRFLINNRNDVIDLARLIADGKQRRLHFVEFERSA